MGRVTESLRSSLRRVAARIRYGVTGAERRVIEAVRRENLTYCGYPKLENLCARMRDVARRGVRGAVLEAGVALGGSAILLAQIKPADAPLLLFDTFGMIPPPSEHDGDDVHRRYEDIASGRSPGLGGQTYYGYVDDLEEVVRGNLTRAGIDLAAAQVQLVPGLFEDTLHLDQPVAFAHVDCDWFASVQVCIERIAPALAPGGIIVFDDYVSYSGCRQAVDAWLAEDPRFSTVHLRRSLSVRKDRDE